MFIVQCGQCSLFSVTGYVLRFKFFRVGYVHCSEGDMFIVQRELCLFFRVGYVHCLRGGYVHYSEGAC